MPTIQDNLLWARYDWRDRGDEWSEPWGTSAHMWYGTILPRILRAVPCDHILEIAPGHGRCTQFLRLCCRRLSVVDLVPDCIGACRARFGEGAGIEYHVNDGRSLPMIGAASVDLVFSWDSLVHVERDVIESYVDEIARVLRPGGRGFLHHSNLGGAPAGDETAAGGDDHARAPSMSAVAFAEACRAAGLHCLSQELIPWGGARMIDCLSFFQRPARGGDASPAPPIAMSHPGFPAEVANLRRLSELYAGLDAGAGGDPKYMAVPAARPAPAGSGRRARDRAGDRRVELIPGPRSGDADEAPAWVRQTRWRGFHAPEDGGRWTDGRGTVTFPEPVPAQALSLELGAYNPGGSRVRISVDGAPAAELELAPGAHATEIPIADRLSRVEIESDTFVPSRLGLGPDHRTLGVFVAGLALR